jgi:DNA-binding MarR family transcriptional regulator/GNAT superfamily N-acetyltransferase
MSNMVAVYPEARAFRRFNRSYTKFIGTLNEGHLNSEFSLPEARVIYEIATREVPKATGIAEELGMDPGYLSRLLGKLQRTGVVEKTPSEKDARSVELRLTPSGKAAFRRLDDLSNQQACNFLDTLSPEKRLELVRAMDGIERIISKNGKRPAYMLRPHRVGDMGWVVHRESIGYAQQYGWDQRFEGLVASIVSDFLRNFDSTRERCWIAEIEGQSVGHVFLVKHPGRADTAQLRLLYVEPGARGMGLGGVLVTECIQFARTAGYRKMVLWTHSILVAAIRIYERAGFQLVKEETHESFGPQVVGQEWELDLTSSISAN